jgi:hypothetical protein
MWPNGTSHEWLVRLLSLRICITLSLNYTLYKSLQLLSSLVIAGERLLTMEIPLLPCSPANHQLQLPAPDSLLPTDWLLSVGRLNCCSLRHQSWSQSRIWGSKIWTWVQRDCDGEGQQKYGAVAGCCGHGNEFSGSIYRGEISRIAELFLGVVNFTASILLSLLLSVSPKLWVPTYLSLILHEISE